MGFLGQRKRDVLGRASVAVAGAATAAGILTSCGVPSDARPDEVGKGVYAEVLAKSNGGSVSVGVASFVVDESGNLTVTVNTDKHASVDTVAIGPHGQNQLKVYPNPNNKSGEATATILRLNGEEKYVPVSIDGKTRGELFSAKTDVILRGKGENAGLSLKPSSAFSGIPAAEYCNRVATDREGRGSESDLSDCKPLSGSVEASVS